MNLDPTGPEGGAEHLDQPCTCCGQDHATCNCERLQSDDSDTACDMPMEDDALIQVGLNRDEIVLLAQHYLTAHFNYAIFFETGGSGMSECFRSQYCWSRFTEIAELLGPGKEKREFLHQIANLKKEIEEVSDDYENDYPHRDREMEKMHRKYEEWTQNLPPMPESGASSEQQSSQ